MIAPVAVSADAVGDTAGVGRQELLHIHAELTRLILRHGVLVIADADAEKYLADQIAKLAQVSPLAAKRWEALLEHAHLVHAGCATTIERITDLGELQKHWNDYVDVALMEADRCEALGAPPGSTRWRAADGTIEVVSHQSPFASDIFAGLRALDDERSVAAGSYRDDVWNSRFAPLVAHADTVHVLDRYLFKAVISSSGTARTNWGAAELGWLLRRLAHDGERLTVNLYTGFPDAWSERTVINAFKTALSSVGSPQGITQINLFAVHDNRWVPHDRHLRVERTGIELSAGWDRFRAQEVKQAFTATYMCGADITKLKREEQAVRTALGQPPTVVWAR